MIANAGAPGEPQAFERLMALYRDGQLAQATDDARTLLERQPENVDVLNLLGACYLGLARHAEAIMTFERALALAPGAALLHANLGRTLQAQGNHAAAIGAFERASAFAPGNVDAVFGMAGSLQALGRIDDAMAAYRQAMAIHPGHVPAAYQAALMLLDAGRGEEAIAILEAALAAVPDEANLLNVLGVVLNGLGRKAEAARQHERAIALQPDFLIAHANLAESKTFTAHDPQIGQLKRLLRDPALAGMDRCRALHCLYKAHEDIGKLRLALDYLMQCNALRKQLLRYSIAQDEQLFATIRQNFVRGIGGDAPANPQAPRPIFILGMPRSGTTLTEQIISSHPDVHSGGELAIWNGLLAPLVANGPLRPEGIRTLRQAYEDRIAPRAGTSRWITDKTTLDFRYAGYIIEAFPEARLIHLCRSPAAVCWSNYTHLFEPANFGFSYDLRDVVAYHGLYRDLMEFWERQYPGRIYHLDYEALTENQEPETRRLIEHLGIGWDDACLAFHQNRRSVRTASQAQVRKKMYTGSSERWRRYRPFLKGAFDSLPERMTVPSTG